MRSDATECYNDACSILNTIELGPFESDLIKKIANKSKMFIEQADDIEKTLKLIEGRFFYNLTNKTLGSLALVTGICASVLAKDIAPAKITFLALAAHAIAHHLYSSVYVEQCNERMHEIKDKIHNFKGISKNELRNCLAMLENAKTALAVS